MPTYNERANIAPLIESLAKYLNGYTYEILVVDDNSPDGTADAAEALSGKYPVKVLRRPRKMGVTSAIHDGFKASSGSVIIVMDADFQHPPELVPRLLSRIRYCDVVVASRYAGGGRIEEWSFIRRAMSMVAVALVRVLVPECRSVKDPVSGFFALWREVLDSWRPVVPGGYKVLVEILATAKPTRVCEEPYVFRARRSGKSKLNTAVVFSFIKLLLKLLF